jgi:Uma2 family endonuclease
MVLKFQFYERHGVEEYYMYDPDRLELSGWIRDAGRLKPIDRMDGWASPRLGIRFQFDESGELKIYRPDGRPFATYVELAEQAEQERERAERLAARLKELGIDPDAPQ